YALLFAGFPRAHLEPTRDDHGVALLDGRARVSRELAVRRDRVPVGFAVDPRGRFAIETTLGGSEPEARDVSAIGRGHETRVCADGAAESNRVCHANSVRRDILHAG